MAEKKPLLFVGNAEASRFTQQEIHLPKKLKYLGIQTTKWDNYKVLPLLFKSTSAPTAARCGFRGLNTKKLVVKLNFSLQLYF